MSAAEMIKELDKMSEEEILELEALLRRRRAEGARRSETPEENGQPAAGRKLSREEARAHVSANYSDLLSRLAQ